MATVTIIVLIVIVVAITIAYLNTKKELNALLIDVTYGVYTRHGIERRAKRMSKVQIVFFDLDGMHDLNSQYGYAEVDRRINASISIRSTDLLVGRWYSGDEIVVITTDGYAVANRLANSLKANGLSATFGVAEGGTLSDAVKVAADKVQAAKANNLRGTIN